MATQYATERAYYANLLTVAGLPVTDNESLSDLQIRVDALKGNSDLPDYRVLDRTYHTGTQAISTITGLQAALDAAGGTADVAGALGNITSLIFVDDQAGASEQVQIENAISASQTFDRNGAVVFSAKQYDTTTPVPWVNGLTFIGTGTGSANREFDDTRTMWKNTSTDIFTLNGAIVRDITVVGMHFEGSLTNLNTNWLTPEASDASAGQLRTSKIYDCGFKGFRSVIRDTPMTVVHIDSTYTNWIGSGGPAWGLVGSDNQFTRNLCDSSYNGATPNLAATASLITIGSLSKSVVIQNFITGSPATPMRVTGGKNCTIADNYLEAPPEFPSLGAGLLITGGNGHIFRSNTYFSTNATNGSGIAGSNGVISITGGTDLWFINERFDWDQTVGEASPTPNTVPPFSATAGTFNIVDPICMNDHVYGVHTPTGSTAVFTYNGNQSIVGNEFCLTPGTGSASAALTQNQGYASRFFLSRESDQVSFEVGTGAASSTLEIHIYEIRNGRPGPLLLELSGSAVSAGMVDVAIGTTSVNGRALWAGEYLVEVVAQGGTPTIRMRNGYTGVIPVLVATTTNTAPASTVRTGITGAAPTTYTPSGNSANAPHLFFRARA